MGQQLDYQGVIRVFPEIGDIKDDHLRNTVAELWIEITAEMPFPTLAEAPKNTTGEGGRNLVDHVRGVTLMALAICEIAEKLHGKAYDRDLMIAAGLLHDLSKPVEYEPDPTKKVERTGVVPGKRSRIGRNLQHAVYGVHKMLSKGLSPELAHLVITHTFASNRRGTTWEAAALFYGDYADSDVGLHSANEKMFSERWKL